MKEIYIRNLVRLGLTEGEAKVYLALLGLGSSTVGPVTERSGVSSSNVYGILQRLIEKGIVSFIIKSKTRYYQAAPPKNLADYLRRKELELEEQRHIFKTLIPELTAHALGTSQQYAELFFGLKGLKAAYEKLYSRPEKTEILRFFCIKFKTDTPDKFYLSYEKTYLQKGIRNRGISNPDYKTSLYVKKSVWGNLRYVRFPIPPNIDIYQNKFVLISWEDEQNPVTIYIESEGIAEPLKRYFDSVWDKATR